MKKGYMKPYLILLKIFFMTLLFIHSGYGEELKCPFQISDGNVVKSSSNAYITGFSFQTKPIIGSDVLGIPYPVGKTVKLKIISAEHVEYPDLGSHWEVNLENGSGTNLNDSIRPHLQRDYISSVAVMWPVPPHGAKVIKVVSTDLPPNVFAETTRVAIDLDNDKKADALLVEFACENRHVNPRKTATDYTCGETWQKVNGKWLLCNSFAED